MTATQIVTVKTDSISFDLSRCRATWLYLCVCRTSAHRPSSAPSSVQSGSRTRGERRDSVERNVHPLTQDWMLAGSCDRLHVTSRRGGKWQHALDPSHLGIRSGRIVRDCANRDCGPFRFGYLTCDHQLLRQKRTASRSQSLGAPTPRRIRTLSTLSLTGARVEARGNLDGCRWQRLRGKAPSRCDPPRRPFRHDEFRHGVCIHH